MVDEPPYLTPEEAAIQNASDDALVDEPTDGKVLPFGYEKDIDRLVPMPRVGAM